jgi:hypothetical protein
MNALGFLRPVATVSAACGFLVASTGCTPSTVYRYSGFVPAAHAIAWDGRVAPGGTLRLEGTMVGATVDRNLYPVIHDTALRVPNTTIEGAAFIAPNKYIELGVRYAYAAYVWGEPSATGTMPMPSHPSLWGVGPEVRIAIPLEKRHRFTLGIAANLIRYVTPYAEWQQPPSGTCVPSANCVVDSTTFPPTQYALVNERSESNLALGFAIYPSVDLGETDELGHVFGGLSFSTGFKNDGFTNTAMPALAGGSTIQQAALVPILGVGYGINVDALRLSGMVTLPLTDSTSAIDFGLGGFVTLGVDLELWESRETKRLRRQPSQSTEPPL